MNVIHDQLTVEPEDEFVIEQVGLRSTPPNPNKIYETLVIRATKTPSTISAKRAYTSGNNLAHLIIGQDGNTVIQMTDFNRRAGSGFLFEKTAIIIALENVGYLLEDASLQSHFQHIDHFPPNQRLTARAMNDRKERQWPRYAGEQLDLLYKVAVTLMNHYGLKFIESHEALNVNALDPGPAFPLASFINHLRQEVPHIQSKPLIPRKAAQTTSLHTGPRANSTQLPDSQIKKGAPVFIIDESEEWSLIEAISENERHWLKGWLKTDQIALEPFTAVVKDHRLETAEGSAFPFIAAAKGNFNPRKDSNRPKYLVMHYTTGTQIQSTINTFRNSANEVSAHLVIGRDGRVIQMVPFNHAAYHAGSGSWERDSNLNNLSIGIELDNAGALTKINGKWTKRGHIIPDDRVEEALHWKDRVPKTFERFPQIQLDVAFRIAKALVEEYHLADIIGHDQISLSTRYDPGPLFPLAEWRESIFGRKEAEIKKFRSAPGTNIYKNYEGIPPRLIHPLVPGVLLGINQQIQIIRREKPYLLIKVRKAGKVTFGWVAENAVKELPQLTKIIQNKPDFYRHFADGAPPPVQLPASPLPDHTEVRIMKIVGNLALVLTLERIGNFPYIEGWVERDQLEEVIE